MNMSSPSSTWTATLRVDASSFAKLRRSKAYRSGEIIARKVAVAVPAASATEAKGEADEERQTAHEEGSCLSMTFTFCASGM